MTSTSHLAIPVDLPLWRRIVPFRALMDTSGTRSRYVMRAWAIATVPSILIAIVFASIASLFGFEPPHRIVSSGFVVAGIVVAPPVETALMIVLYFCLALVIWRGEALRIAVMATLASLAHVIGGSWQSAVYVFWPFCVFSTALVAWRERSFRDAFVVVTSIHALHNATSLALVALFTAAIHAA